MVNGDLPLFCGVKRGLNQEKFLLIPCEGRTLLG